MEKLPISFCILSWNNLETLKNTLKSYKKNGLLNFSDDVVILFQEISKEDKRIADKYKVKYIGLNNNVGIGAGIKLLAENAVYDHILFLENDWELVEKKDITFSRLKSGLIKLTNGFKVVRYRSRKNPGHPLFSIRHKGNELDYYDDWHQCTSPHLLESLHWLDPSVEFPDKIEREGDEFVTTSRWANWTNNPFLINKKFLLETILPFAGESVSFEKNIASWWVKQNFKIAQGEGLFKHNDLKKYPKKNFLRKIISKLKNKIKK
ncbi:MAG: glycosyltransferase [Chryseobacterium sp.]|nr:MAG: glycosyltransferase [Chryseobacterium sp.]